MTSCPAATVAASRSTERLALPRDPDAAPFNMLMAGRGDADNRDD
jgi:hypothetical protein